MPLLQQAIQASPSLATLRYEQLPLERLGEGESQEGGGMTRGWRKQTTFVQEHETWIIAVVFFLFLGGALSLILYLGNRP